MAAFFYCMLFSTRCSLLCHNSRIYGLSNWKRRKISQTCSIQMQGNSGSVKHFKIVHDRFHPNSSASAVDIGNTNGLAGLIAERPCVVASTPALSAWYPVFESWPVINLKCLLWIFSWLLSVRPGKFNSFFKWARTTSFYVQLIQNQPLLRRWLTYADQKASLIKKIGTECRCRVVCNPAIHIYKIRRLNPDPVTGYPQWGFSWISPVTPDKYRGSASN
jgi:hypothetical protein